MLNTLQADQILPLIRRPQPLLFGVNHSHHFCRYLRQTNTIRTWKIGKCRFRLPAQSDDSQSKLDPQDQQLNLSVLRFTFGIPGLDESYLPRWIGYGFGALIVLNHFVGSSSPVTSAQLVSEALGISMAAFSISLPYFGKFLKGATPVYQPTLPQEAEQIFVMSHNMSDTLKEDLAWATYILLRNTNSVSVLMCVQDALCVRGYWRQPDTSSGASSLEWFERQIKSYGLADIKGNLYFPQNADSELEELLPKGVSSVLVQPVLQVPKQIPDDANKAEGFVLLTSTIAYAYSDKDRSWIRAVASKFAGGIS